jgi:hypothetical protein
MKLTTKQALRKLIDSIDVVYINDENLPLVVDTQAVSLNGVPDTWPEFTRMGLVSTLKGNELIEVVNTLSKHKRKVFTFDVPTILTPESEVPPRTVYESEGQVIVLDR